MKFVYKKVLMAPMGSSFPCLRTLDPLLDVDPVARMESFRVLKS
jgi:hypothetical protein